MNWENDSGEDSDAVDQTELEVALYSQIHFDPVSSSDLSSHLTYNTPWLTSPHNGSQAKQMITVSEHSLSSRISKGEGKEIRKQSVQSLADGKENNQSKDDSIQISKKTELDLLICKRDSFIKLLNKLPGKGKKKKKIDQETTFTEKDSFIKQSSKSPLEIKKKPKSSSTPKLKKVQKPKTVSVTYNQDSDTDCSDDVEEYLSILEKSSNKESTTVDVRAKHTKTEEKEHIKLVISDSDDIITINNETGDSSIIMINDESFITIDETFSKSGSLEKSDKVHVLSDGEDVITILDESGKSRSKLNKGVDEDDSYEKDDDSSVDVELNYDGIEFDISDEDININTEIVESSEDEIELKSGEVEAELESGEDEAELESGEDESELESGEDEAELESGEDELVGSGDTEESEPDSSSDVSSEEDMNFEEMAAKPDLSLQFNLFEDGKTLLKPGPDDAEKAKWKINDEDHYKITTTMNRYFAPKSIQCRNCKELGHMSRDCPQPMKRRCAFCGEEGHPHQGCPGAFCFKCNCPGHRVKDCTNPRQNTRDPCPRCWVTGHKENMCPDLWRQCRTTVTAGITGVVTGEKRAASVNYCYNCGRSGHLGYECKETRMSHFIPACFPFVVQYDERDKRLYTALGWRDLIKDKGHRVAHENKNNSSRDQGKKDRKRGKRGGEKLKEKEKRSKGRQSQRASLGDGENFPRNRKYMKPDGFLNSMDDFHGRGKDNQNDKSYYEEELEEYSGHQVSNNEYWNKEKKKKKKKGSKSDSRTPKKFNGNSQPDTSEEVSQRHPRTQHTSFEYIDSPNSSYDQSYNHSPSKKRRTHEDYSGDFRVNRTVENEMFGDRRNQHNKSFNDKDNRSFNDRDIRSFNDRDNRSFDQGDGSFDDGDRSFSNRSFKNRGNSYKNRDNREQEFVKKNSGIRSYQNPKQMKHSKSFPELKRHETKQNKSGFRSRNTDFMHMADKCKQNFRNNRY